MSAFIANPTVRSIIKGVLVWAPLWISTTVLFGGIGVAYVFLVKQDTYLASQALLVRDEATGAVMRLGRFQSQAEMKAAQETILEMAKSQAVVRDALVAVGPPKGLGSWLDWGDYPSASFGRVIRVRPCFRFTGLLLGVMRDNYGHTTSSIPVAAWLMQSSK